MMGFAAMSKWKRVDADGKPALGEAGEETAIGSALTYLSTIMKGELSENYMEEVEKIKLALAA